MFIQREDDLKITKLLKDCRQKARYCEYPECSKSRGEMSLKACARCQLVYYCCLEHQKLHWKEHKMNCQTLI